MRCSFECAIALFLLLGLGCEKASSGGAESDPTADLRRRLLAIEDAIRREPRRYADPSGLDDGRYRPAGAYLEEETLWVYSRAQWPQLGLRAKDGRWEVSAKRTGPADTRRCIATGSLAFGTVCVGYLERGGLLGFDRPQLGEQLPQRGGFTDVAVREDELLVVDSIAPALWVIDREGAVRKRIPLSPGSHAVRPLDGQRLLVLSHQAPELAILEASGSLTALRSGTPVRDVAIDETRGLVWTVGPANRLVRRRNGYIEDLYSTVVGYRLDAPEPNLPVVELDLRQKRLVDGVDIALFGDRLAVVAAGSDALWVVHPETHHDVVVPTGLTPSASVVAGHRIFVTNRLDDSVTVVRFDAPLDRPATADQISATSVPLGPRPHVLASPTALGELLFYQRALWSDDVLNDFTCNSCHWDGLTDHRLQPGFGEQRWEMTRPAVGIAGVAPLFSPMGSSSLSAAIEGLFSALDVRYWTEHGQRLFLEPVDVRVGGLVHRVDPGEARRALLSYAMRLAPAIGPLRRPDRSLTDAARTGLQLFMRDCARCHEPTADMRTRERLPGEAIEEALREGPLTFGAPLFNQSGVEPYYTPHGNRISPLIALYRGGPFFTDGSAATLEDVVEMTDPTQRLVHAAATGDFYDETEKAALVAFLLSL